MLCIYRITRCGARNQTKENTPALFARVVKQGSGSPVSIAVMLIAEMEGAG